MNKIIEKYKQFIKYGIGGVITTHNTSSYTFILGINKNRY